MNKEELKERLDDYYSRVGYMKGAVIKISKGELHELYDRLKQKYVYYIEQDTKKMVGVAGG